MLKYNLIVALLAVPIYAFGQPLRQFNQHRTEGPVLEVNPSTTRSIRGWKVGGQLGMKFRNKYAIGVFGYSELSDESKKDSFWGIYGLWLLNRYSRIQAGPSLRAGFFRGRFLAVIPTMEVVAHITRSIGIAGAMGYSDRFPYFDLKMAIGL